MRLLDTNSLQLVAVREDAIPKYAILSHTWGDEEITLQELQELKGSAPPHLSRRRRKISKKRGYHKVVDAARLAASRGFAYIWIDTCCIDKTSSSELSEAINSMYLWYQQSSECYAILSDVDNVKDKDWALENSSFRRSRWFTRGWTLQELVAPEDVFFYSRDWKLIGKKDGDPEFKATISSITGIAEDVLDSRISPNQLSVATRMSWASHRKTTRLEDLAYCLLGLFEVSMPLLYGEGYRAFTKLQEEIIRRTEDQSIYAWNSFEEQEEDPDALSGLLAHSPAQFRDAGRIQALPPTPLYASAPSDMTSHGLRVQLYLRPILAAEGVPMEEDYYAILDCFEATGEVQHCPAIRLRKLSADQYGRLETKTRKWLPPATQSESLPDGEGYTTVFVRQLPVYYHMPEFRISPSHDWEYHKLADVFPPRQWNSSMKTFKVKYSRRLKALGIFRFSLPQWSSNKVDVVVGLWRLDAVHWQGWCFQLVCSSPDGLLQSVLSSVNSQIEELSRTRNEDLTSVALKELIGDDPKLMTEASVEGSELHGRLYISLVISTKPQLQSFPIAGPMPRDSSILMAKDVRPIILAPFHEDDTMPYRETPKLTPTDTKVRVHRRVPVAYYRSGRPNPMARWGPEDMFSARLMTFFPDNTVGIAATSSREPTLDAGAAGLREYAVAASRNSKKDLLLDISDRLTDPSLLTEDPYGFAPIHWAVAGGSEIAAIDRLLERGVDPMQRTRNGWTIMHVAVIFGQPLWVQLEQSQILGKDTITELINSRTPVDEDTPLHFAAAWIPISVTGLDFFKQLWEKAMTSSFRFVRNKYDETPLHRAAAFNNTLILGYLIGQCRPHLDVADRHGRSPLWHATAAAGHASTTAMSDLLRAGANPNAADDFGLAPLHVACRGGFDGAVRVLLQFGARPAPATEPLDLTPLDFAVLSGHLGCAQQLLDSLRGASADWNRNRSLHFAVSGGSMACVRLLFYGLDHVNPDVSFPDYIAPSAGGALQVINEATSARSLASKLGRPDISTVLRGGDRPAAPMHALQQSAALNYGDDDDDDDDDTPYYRSGPLAPTSTPRISSYGISVPLVSPSRSRSRHPTSSGPYGGMSLNAAHSTSAPSRSHFAASSSAATVRATSVTGPSAVLSRQGASSLGAYPLGGGWYVDGSVPRIGPLPTLQELADTAVYPKLGDTVPNNASGTGEGRAVAQGRPPGRGGVGAASRIVGPEPEIVGSYGPAGRRLGGHEPASVGIYGPAHGVGQQQQQLLRRSPEAETRANLARLLGSVAPGAVFRPNQHGSAASAGHALSGPSGPVELDAQSGPEGGEEGGFERPVSGRAAGKRPASAAVSSESDGEGAKQGNTFYDESYRGGDWGGDDW